MKRTICTSLLALLLLAGVAVPAQASAMFPPTAVYEGQFTDVLPTDWFYDNVAALYALGLTNGKGDTTHYAPESEITVAEALTLAARLRSLYDFGGNEVGASFFRAEHDTWYTPYVDFLRYAGIIGDEFDGRYDLPATRAELAHIMANILPADLFENINADAVNIGYAVRQFIRDVDDYTPYQQDILTLYRWGIVNGTDKTGSFLPNATIRRSEVAAMVSRLIYSELRITLPWNVREEQEFLSLADLVTTDGTFHTAPNPGDAAAIDANIRYMLALGERSFTLDYGAPQREADIRIIMDTFLSVMRRYPEQTYNHIHVSYSLTDGKISVRFSSSLYDDTLLNTYREKIFASALAVREELYATGLLSTEMSEYDKARVLFDWLCGYCDYDFDAGATSLSHSAFGVFKSRLAVCDGYTAAYNLLLRLEGIECTAVDLESWDHMWTVAVLDGISYHIDVTWGDQTNTVADYYFAMTEEESLSRFR